MVVADIIPNGLSMGTEIDIQTVRIIAVDCSTSTLIMAEIAPPPPPLYTANIPSVSHIHEGIPDYLIGSLQLDQNVEAGSPLNALNVKNADDAASVLRQLQGKENAITDEVLETAKNRAWVLRSTHAQVQFQQGGNDGLMAMLNQMRQEMRVSIRGINQHLERLDRRLEGFDRRLDGFDQRFEDLTKEVAGVRATVNNGRIIKQNRLIRSWRGDGGPDRHYFLRNKEIAGSGRQLALNVRPGRHPPGIDAVPPPAIGTVPNINLNPFHAQADQILRLIYFYNNDFGILPEDNLEAQREKLERWLTEHKA